MLQHYQTQSGVEIEYLHQPLDYQAGIDHLLTKLDVNRGALFASSFEFPGRYTCWDVGFCNPPLAITMQSNQLYVDALNERGVVLLSMLQPILIQHQHLNIISADAQRILLSVRDTHEIFCEEERSRQPSVFTLIRLILAFFKSDEEHYLGLYGAFGFDMIHQFETLPKHKPRDPSQRDMVLYLPDEIYMVNHRKEEAFVRRYDFKYQGLSTVNLPRDGVSMPWRPVNKPSQPCDHKPGEYVKTVHEAKKKFACGDLFEVVPSQTFYTEYQENPSTLFQTMRQHNPSPYGFFINLGEEEYLVGASPEMYVRVQGSRVETCPISGTIRRGANAIEDATNIQALLDSPKEASELTMCTDVDRNDKSRICIEGSVRVIGRRQIELYSRLIHTVDHVEGYLRDAFDAVDAFLTHMWVVTVTGAPKLWAMNFIEQHEKTPRKWYGGAVGWFGFDGDLNTGLVLRTVRLNKGVAELRVGATLLNDSIPEAEEAETVLKASAFMDMLKGEVPVKPLSETPLIKNGIGKRVLLIDHQDSFVHTLANYFRQTGAEVVTVRFDMARDYLNTHEVHLAVLSPGPGRPSDFQLNQTLAILIEQSIPVFGVCLGLQGIVEYFGGDLDTLTIPMHGKASEIHVLNKHPLFNGLKDTFTAGRYHSLHARRSSMPDVLSVTAATDDGIIMAVSHQSLPIHAVQFHPETILSLADQAGLKIISNVVEMLG